MGGHVGELEQARQFWTGPAGTAFDSLMRRWDDETTKLNKVLIDLEDALRGTVSREKFELAQKNYTLRQLAYRLEENLPACDKTHQKIKI